MGDKSQPPRKSCRFSTIVRLSTPKPIHPDNIPDKPSIYWLDYLEPNANLRLRTPGELKQYYDQFYTKLPRLENLSRPKTTLCNKESRPCTANGVSKSALHYCPSERIHELSKPKYVSKNFNGTGLFVTYRRCNTVVQEESRTDWNSTMKTTPGIESERKSATSLYYLGSKKTDYEKGDTMENDMNEQQDSTMDARTKRVYLPKLPAGKSVGKSMIDMKGFKTGSAQNNNTLESKNPSRKPITRLPPVNGSIKKAAPRSQRAVEQNKITNKNKTARVFRTFSPFY